MPEVSATSHGSRIWKARTDSDWLKRNLNKSGSEFPNHFLALFVVSFLVRSTSVGVCFGPMHLFLPDFGERWLYNIVIFRAEVALQISHPPKPLSHHY